MVKLVGADRAVLFDWDDTLCGAWPHRYDTVQRVLGDFGIVREYHEVHRAWVVAADPVVERIASGFWLRFQRALGLEAESGTAPSTVIEALAAAFDRRDTYRRFEVFTDARAVLDHLSGAGWQVGIVSNNVEAQQRVAELGLTERFVTVVTPRDTGGVGKPEAAIFQLALDRLGVTPDRAIYVGDTYEVDVLGTQAIGIQAFLIDRMGIYARDGYASLSSLLDIIRRLGG